MQYIKSRREIQEKKVVEKKDEGEEKKDEDDPYNQWKKHLEELEKKFQKKKLTKEEEKALVHCIRFSFLSHADLISLTNDPIMKDYKELSLQGLSARLNKFDKAFDKTNLNDIDIKQRYFLRGPQICNLI